jgi:hypothetical protein
MAVRIPPALEQGSDPGVIVDATYFVIRALRNVLRQYDEITVSREGSEPAFQLAKLALGEIVEMEGGEAVEISAKRLLEYIERLEDFSNQTYEISVGGYDAERAAELLDGLRESKPR